METVYEVLEKGRYANLALEHALRASTLNWADRHLVTEIVNGTVRMVRHLDWVLDLFLTKPVSKQQPWIRNVLRISLYQLRFMDRIPAYACVDDAVKLATRKAGRKLAAVVNGVLRNYLRSPEKVHFPAEDHLQHMALRYSYPDWLVEEFARLVDNSELEELLSYLNSPPPVVARVNRLKVDKPGLLDRLRQERVRAEAGRYTPWSIHIRELKQPVSELNSYGEGLFYLQNEGSMLAAAILDPPPEGLVYDLGAGVGGKSTHMAEWMNDQGRIIAVELHAHKLGLLKANCQRLGIKSVQPLQSDITTLGPALPLAERVLLDAPCSGWGVLNRRADARWRLSQEAVTNLPELQFRLLQAAAGLLKAGGLLLYSTCTINPAENEQVIARFLQAAPFELQGFAENIGFFPLTAEDSEKARRGCLTLMPGRYHCDGMFYALMRRKGHE